jgi:hypothetical protein
MYVCVKERGRETDRDRDRDRQKHKEGGMRKGNRERGGEKEVDG